jgi:hypothetical protein
LLVRFQYVTFVFGMTWLVVLYSVATAAKKYPKNKVLKALKPLGPLLMCLIGILVMSFSNLEEKMVGAGEIGAQRERARDNLQHAWAAVLTRHMQC